MDSLIHTIGSLDKRLFLFLNGLHQPAFDDIMVSVSGRWVWIPLYAILFYWMLRNFRIKSIYLLAAVILLVVCTDQLSVLLFKDVVQRLRPCHDPRLAGMVYIIDNHCGGKYGFVSSHAANSFGLAYYLGMIFRGTGKYWMSGLLLWATVISFSRIYLGVHYPLDVVAGAFLGIAMAILIYRLLRFCNTRLNLGIFSQ